MKIFTCEYSSQARLASSESISSRCCAKPGTWSLEQRGRPRRRSTSERKGYSQRSWMHWTARRPSGPSCAARPDAIVHQLTAIPANLNLRRFDREFALTNRLRTEGTDNLLAAARAAGVRRVVAQSFAGWTYERAGGSVKTEDDPLDPDPPPAFRRTLDAIRYLEAALQAAEGIETIALRYGWFYGPGTSLGRGGALLDAIRRRQLPIVGSGTGIWSFTTHR